jgi:hypothetical protein
VGKGKWGGGLVTAIRDYIWDYSNWQYLRHGLTKCCFGMFWENS